DTTTVPPNARQARCHSGLDSAECTTLRSLSRFLKLCQKVSYKQQVGAWGPTTVTQSTISGNKSNYGNGGGIFSSSGLTVSQSTISGNTARRGDGIYGSGYLYNDYYYGGVSLRSDGSMLITNSIVSGIDGLKPTDSASSHNLIGSPNYSGGMINGVNGNIVGQDDGAGNRTDLDMATVLETTLADHGGPVKILALVGGSPAINAGDNALIPLDAADLDGDGNRSKPVPFDTRGNGFARVINGQVDIGAFELEGTSPVLPVVNVSVSADWINEDADGTLVFAFTRNNTSGTLTANFSLTGTATIDDDYSASAVGSVTFADGQSTVALTIDPTADTDVESNETVIATVLPGTGYRVGGLSPNATATVTNDDASLSVSRTTAYKAEGNSGVTPVTFSIYRQGSPKAITVNYVVTGSGVTPVDASDFGGTLPSGTITFAANEYLQQITVNVTGDMTIEPDEGLTLTLSNPVGAVLATSSTSVTVLDDDAPATNTYVVDTLSDELDSDFGPGDFSLREAIERANAMPGTQTITFAPSLTADGRATIVLNGQELPVTSALNIIGPGADRLTIDANRQSGIFFITDYQQTAPLTVNIEGLTLTRASRSAISNSENLNLTACRITDNQTPGYGGGIAHGTGTLNLLRSEISNNDASQGGGIYCFDGSLKVQQSTISGNIANDGGGIRSYRTTGSFAILNSTISGNTASGEGGGISVRYSSPTGVVITQSTISGNSAESGGGMHFERSASLTISQSTIVGNSAMMGAGGLWVSDLSKVTLNNTVLAGNDANRVPNDISTYMIGSVSSNSKNNLIGDPAHAGGLTNGVNGNIVGNGAGGVLNLSNVLSPTLANNGGSVKTHALVFGSPAINAGSNSVIPADANDLDGDGNVSESLPFDQRGSGFARVVGSVVDIGAFEYSPTTVSVTVMAT
ncbi:MAG: hypothetical protein NT013_07680, partial [Planctomycetia bacterium]|nr:hypothetical protein [Planctomycetia bacterium]